MNVRVRRPFLERPTSLAWASCFILCCAFVAAADPPPTETERVTKALIDLGAKIEYSRKNPKEPFSLDLQLGTVDHDDIKLIARLPSLEVLNLNATSLKDIDLIQVAKLTKLTELFIRQTDVTDNGMLHLRKLSKLRVLDATLTAIIYKGLQDLECVGTLEELYLWNTRIDDDGVAALAPKLTNLRRLALTETGIGDKGLMQLTKMLQLKHLFLENTQVSDASLEILPRIPNLSICDVSGTRVTRKAIQNFRDKNRKIEIIKEN